MTLFSVRRRAVRGGAVALAALTSVSLVPFPAARAAQRAPKPPKKPPVSSTANYVVTVNAAQARHGISPLVYGVNYADNAQLVDLNAPLHRMGGNNTSRYNWEQNADNRGRDWYFQSIAEPSATPGERADSFIGNSKASGAEPMMTIPMVGYVAKLGAGRNKLSSFSIAKYGAQTGNDWQWFPDAGNGILASTGRPVVGNDPLDANVAADHDFMRPWVEHMVGRWGTAVGGSGLRYYIYDNEPSLWHDTHRDVHPTGATMEEVRDKIVAYGTMIRSVDPGAKLVGPEEWGWSGFLFSGFDQQYGSQHGWGYLPDRAAHGGMDYVPWLLQQLRQHETNTGVRVLDVFTLHYYPQGGEFSDDVSQAMQLRRNRSTRSLWDPAYRDETWINDFVRLVPRMRDWVNAHYPGLKTGITEYNWGAEGHINGATTQADVYGIFGREDLDMGTRWTTPATSSPTYKAMKMFRSYDGNKSGFGETSVQATSTSNADDLSAFASVRAKDGALTVVLVNKMLTASNAVTVNLQNFAPGAAGQVWQLTGANSINRLADAAVASNALTLTVPAQSVTMVVVPPATPGLVKGPELPLEKYEGDAAGLTATVELRAPGTTTALETRSVPLLSPGALTFHTARRGTFDVAVRVPGFLRRRFAGVTVSESGAATLGSVTLTNGDADGDNQIGLGDATMVSRANGSTPGGSNWNASADLNGDGRVNQADYDIVTANFRAAGDP